MLSEIMLQIFLYIEAIFNRETVPQHAKCANVKVSPKIAIICFQKEDRGEARLKLFKKSSVLGRRGFPKSLKCLAGYYHMVYRHILYEQYKSRVFN